MRRLMLGVIGLAMLATTGCLAVSAKENQISVPAGDTEVVAVDDHVYMVNKETGEIRELDLSQAKPYQPAKPLRATSNE